MRTWDTPADRVRATFRLDAHHGPRIVVAAFAGVLFCLASGQPAAAITPKALLRSCEAVVAGVRVREVAELEIPRTGLRCWYFMSAVQSMSVLIDQDGDPLLGSCVPANTTLLDYVRAFVRYARRLRTYGSGNAAALVVEALGSTFPCGHRESAGLRPIELHAPAT